MSTRRRFRFWASLGTLAIAVPVAVILHGIFFGVIAPNVKAARQNQTARVFLERSLIDPEGMERVSGAPGRAFGKDAGFWSVTVPLGQEPEFNPVRLPKVNGASRSEVLRLLRLRLPADLALSDAEVWTGTTRLGSGTFCSSRACAVNAVRVGDKLFFEISAY